MSRTLRPLLAVVLSVALIGSIVIAGVTVPGHQASTGEHTQESYLRVVHASPDAQPVDVYVDDQQVASNVAFGNASDYMNVSAGEHSIEITAAGDDNATVFNDTVELESGKVYTLAASGQMMEGDVGDAGADGNETDGNETDGNETEDGQAGGFQAQTNDTVLLEDGALHPGNESALRVVHLASNVSDVTLTTTVDNETVVLANGSSFGDDSDYVNLPPGDYTIELRMENETDGGVGGNDTDTDGNETDGNDTDADAGAEDTDDTETGADTTDDEGTVVATVEVSLEAGNAYTAFLVGSADGDLGAQEAGLDSSINVTTVQDPTLTVNFPGEDAAGPGADTTTATPDLGFDPDDIDVGTVTTEPGEFGEEETETVTPTTTEENETDQAGTTTTTTTTEEDDTGQEETDTTTTSEEEETDTTTTTEEEETDTTTTTTEEDDTGQEETDTTTTTEDYETDTTTTTTTEG